MSRSRSLALGRLDGDGEIVVLRPADVSLILESLRYRGQDTADNGATAAGEQRLITRLADLAQMDGAQWTIERSAP